MNRRPSSPDSYQAASARQSRRLIDVRALILDVGGVLMDERRTYARFRRQALARLPSSDARALLLALRESIRERAPSASRRALEQLGGDAGLAAEIWNLIGNCDHPYPEATHALRRLAAGSRLALLGNQGAECRARLDNAGILSHFEPAVISAEVGLAKPDPEIFKLVLRHLDLQPDQVVMVGDRLDLDIAPAKQLGLKTVRMLRGPHVWQRPLTLYERPDATVRSLSELATLILGEA
jgi:HAD superfamily hydrolase (TIGR01493 family)